MSITSEETELSPPADLPTDPSAFWGTPPVDLLKADVATPAELPVIDQLGSAPFKKLDKGGFPFLGFLASVYEHVSTTALAELHTTALTDESPTSSSEPEQVSVEENTDEIG